MKKLTMLFAAAALTIAMSSVASAQTATATGTLAVSATVQGTMSLTFKSDAAGIALGNSGTSAATMAFGTVQAFGGTTPANVTNTTLANAFRLDTLFDITVQKSNITSTDYNLTAQLASADANNTWSIGGVGVKSGAAAPILANGTYGDTQLSFALTVPFTAPAGSINNTVNFTASPN